MHKFYTLKKTTRAAIILTGALLVYGYLCRLLGIYFFWESKYIGWSLLFITIVLLLSERIQAKKAAGKTITSEKIAVGAAIFPLIIQFILLVTFPLSGAYEAARTYLQTSKMVIDEVGEPNSIVLIPAGSYSSSSTGKGEQGEAELHFIVKGKSKIKDYDLLLVKELNSNWKTEAAE